MFIGFIFFGKFFTRNKFYILLAGIIIIYIFGTGSYPDIFQTTFRIYGDKFTFVKASDMLLAIVVSNIIALNLLSRKSANLYFIFSVAMFLPLLIQMSRGTAVAIGIFAFLYIIFNLRFYFKLKNLLVLTLLTPLVFIISTFRVTQYNFSDISIDELETVVIQSAPNEIDKIKRVDNRNSDEIDPFWSFYVTDGRLISTDGTFNWRLNIWQDQYEYQKSINKSFFGYGYNVLLPVFDLQVDSQNIWNIGHDQQNRHVHNYLVNVYSRGGILQLILIIGFHLGLYIYYYKKFHNHRILLMFIPLMFNSMTDITMEGVQFPINFYLIYGYILSTGIKSYREIEVS
jgi:O-antigen ligase